ncbi:hypothetical protein B9031_025750 [Klebsiella aerogenes]|nr:hypothetical protein B9031_025750 [Klebsiella aerogenes]
MHFLRSRPNNGAVDIPPESYCSVRLHDLPGSCQETGYHVGCGAGCLPVGQPSAILPRLLCVDAQLKAPPLRGIHRT